MIGAAWEFLSSFSPTAIFVWFQALLVLAYLCLVVASAMVLPRVFESTVSIRVPVSTEKVWEHVEDVQKNPVSSKMTVKSTIVTPNKEWKEDIGNGEVVVCETVQSERPLYMIRILHSEAVNMKAEWTYMFEEERDNEWTLVRIHASVHANWGSFFTPFLRLVMTYTNGVEQGVKDYFELLCKDLAVPLEFLPDPEPLSTNSTIRR